MSICLDCGYTYNFCRCEEPQDVASPNLRETTCAPMSAATSCDSPELSEARHFLAGRILPSEYGGPSATMAREAIRHGQALLRMVDDLRELVRFLDADRAKLGEKNQRIKNNWRETERERDDLRAKLDIANVTITMQQTVVDQTPEALTQTQARCAELYEENKELRAKLAQRDHLLSDREKARYELEVKLAELTEQAERDTQTYESLQDDAERWLREKRELEAELAEAEKQVEISSQWAATYFDKTMTERKRAEAAKARVEELEAVFELHRSVCGL